MLCKWGYEHMKIMRSALFIVMFMALPLGVFAGEDPPTPDPVAVEAVQLYEVDHDGIRFAFDARLAEAVGVLTFEATTGDVQIPSPAFTEFRFDGYAPGDHLRFAPLPRVDVYAIADFDEYPYFVEQHQKLTALLAERPDLSAYVVANPGRPDAEPLPFLPIFPAAQVFRAMPAYISTGSVEGIRYLTHYSQSADPIYEGQAIYTFQGITRDGVHYVSAVLPMATGVLPTDINVLPDGFPDFDDFEGFADAYQDYLDAVVMSVDGADSDGFYPSLRIMDQLAASIEVSR